MSRVPRTLDASAIVSQIGRRQDAIRLALLLIDLRGGVTADEPHFLPAPHVLQIPLMFKLLESEQGRSICANLPRIAFDYLPQHLPIEHQAEVARMFFVKGEAHSTRHLRFVLERGGEVRYDVRSDVVESDEPGEMVFESSFLRRLGCLEPY